MTLLSRHFEGLGVTRHIYATSTQLQIAVRMGAMLVRFLNVVQAAHVSFLDQGAFERWGEPTLRGPWRLAGIDLNKARNRHVVDALVGLSTQPDGFTLSQ